MRRRAVSKSCAVVAQFDPVNNAASAPNIVNTPRGMSWPAQQSAESTLLQLLLHFFGGPIRNGSLRHVGNVDADAEVVCRSGDRGRQCHAPLLRSVTRQVAPCLL